MSTRYKFWEQHASYFVTFVVAAVSFASCGRGNRGGGTGTSQVDTNSLFPNIGEKYRYAVQISYEADVWGDKFDTAYSDTCTLWRHKRDSVLWIANDVSYKPYTYPNETPINTIILEHFTSHEPFALNGHNALEEKQIINDDNVYISEYNAKLILINNDSILVTKYIYDDDRANKTKKLVKRKFYGHRIPDINYK